MNASSSSSTNAWFVEYSRNIYAESASLKKGARPVAVIKK